MIEQKSATKYYLCFSILTMKKNTVIHQTRKLTETNELILQYEIF